VRLDEKWIRTHLPKELSAQPIDCFSGEYLDGLTVMHEGERGGEDVVVYRANDEEDLRWWQLEQVCRFIHEPSPPERKIWRYYRDMLDWCKKLRVPIVVSSDAHDPSQVGQVGLALELLNSVDFPNSLVLNLDTDKLIAFLK